MPHQQLGVLASAALSIAMVAALALLWGAWRMIAKEKQTCKGVLMIVCALVLIGNVLIWSL